MAWNTYLITQALGMAAFNAICNAGYTSFLWRSEDALHYDAIGTDLALTPVWIGLLSVLLGTPFIRRALADGRMMREAGIGAPRFSRLVQRHSSCRLSCWRRRWTGSRGARTCRRCASDAASHGRCCAG